MGKTKTKKKRDWKLDLEPTILQKKAFRLALEKHGKISPAMREAGYTAASAKNPKDLTKTVGWQKLLKKYLPDDLLLKVHKEGLGAIREEYRVVGKKKNGMSIYDFVKVPDYQTRHRYLETGYKVRKKLDNSIGDPLKDILGEEQIDEIIFRRTKRTGPGREVQPD